GIPVAVVRGLGELVLPPDDHGPGAAALIRPEETDLFGWGAADAVRVAIRRDAAGAADGFPAPAEPVGSLVDDAMRQTDPAAIDLRPSGPRRWQVVPAAGAAPADAAWEAG